MAEKIGIKGEIPAYHKRQIQYYSTVTWKYETVTAKSKSQDRYRDPKTGRLIKKP